MMTTKKLTLLYNKEGYHETGLVEKRRRLSNLSS